MLQTIDVLTIVLAAIRLYFYSFTVLLVLTPLSFVSSSIAVLVESLAMSVALLPGTLIHVSVLVNDSALAILLIIFPKSLVHGSIGPHLYTVPMTCFVLGVPLALVVRTIFHLLERPSVKLVTVRRLATVIPTFTFQNAIHFGVH